MSNPGTLRDGIDALLGKVPTNAPVPFQRVSKHHKGRIPALSPDRKARKLRADARSVQARKRQYLDLQAMLRAKMEAHRGE